MGWHSNDPKGPLRGFAQFCSGLLSLCWIADRRCIAWLCMEQMLALGRKRTFAYVRKRTKAGMRRYSARRGYDVSDCVLVKARAPHRGNQ